MQALTGTSLRLAAGAPSACLPMASSEIFGGALRVSAAPLRTSPASASQSLVIEAGSVPRREKVKTRHMRIRRKLSGTAERPRLAVFRSNKHIYAQVIDDGQMHTLAAASTMTPAIREEITLTAGPTVEASRRVGAEIAKICLEKGITKVAFDRGGFIYHGRIKALAEGAREAGLEF